MTTMDKDKIRAFFTGLSDKKSRLLLFLGIGGMFLILLSSLIPDKEEPASVSENISQQSAAAYAETLSEQLTSFIGAIEGAGETRVLVTLENNGESRYLRAENIDQTKEVEGTGKENRAEEYVLVDDENGRSAVLISFNEPEIRGVAVICEGGDIPAVQARVTDIVTALLHISSARVSVSKMAKP